MITEAENERLTGVGAGTPGGNLLRRYWHPVAPTIDLNRENVLPIELLGERLTLFRTRNGDLGLVQERCAHRSVSLSYGIPAEQGIRCPYHGWLYSTDGQCLEQPYDDLQGAGTFRRRIHITAYRARELGGLVWAYLGPEPVPELPRWDLLVDADRIRSILWTVLPCNYLQIMENSLDPVHFEWLHAGLGNLAAEKRGSPPVMIPRRHLKIAFDEYEFGIVKRRLLEGDAPDSEDWTVGHPVIFPTTLAQGANLQLRVPMNDRQTLHFYYRTRALEDGEMRQAEVPAAHLPYLDEQRRHIVDSISGQDMMAWVTPGAIAPRPLENVGRSDRGVLLYRKMLQDNIKRVEEGKQPLGLIFDPTRNEPMISIVRETEPLRAFRMNLSVAAMTGNVSSVENA